MMMLNMSLRLAVFVSGVVYIATKSTSPQTVGGLCLDNATWCYHGECSAVVKPAPTEVTDHTNGYVDTRERDVTETLWVCKCDTGWKGKSCNDVIKYILSDFITPGYAAFGVLVVLCLVISCTYMHLLREVELGTPRCEVPWQITDFIVWVKTIDLREISRRPMRVHILQKTGRRIMGVIRKNSKSRSQPSVYTKGDVKSGRLRNLEAYRKCDILAGKPGTSGYKGGSEPSKSGSASGSRAPNIESEHIDSTSADVSLEYDPQNDTQLESSTDMYAMKSERSKYKSPSGNSSSSRKTSSTRNSPSSRKMPPSLSSSSRKKKSGSLSSRNTSPGRNSSSSRHTSPGRGSSYSRKISPSLHSTSSRKISPSRNSTSSQKSTSLKRRHSDTPTTSSSESTTSEATSSTNDESEHEEKKEKYMPRASLKHTYLSDEDLEETYVPQSSSKRIVASVHSGRHGSGKRKKGSRRTGSGKRGSSRKYDYNYRL